VYARGVRGAPIKHATNAPIKGRGPERPIQYRVTELLVMSKGNHCGSRVNLRQIQSVSGPFRHQGDTAETFGRCRAWAWVDDDRS
jgi:hypothetical protein